MIATRLGIDTRRAAKLPPDNHRYLLVEAALVQVGYERKSRVVQLWGVVAERGKVALPILHRDRERGRCSWSLFMGLFLL